jgi:predicted aspartyl protease
MAKPVIEVKVAAPGKKKFSKLEALFDTGSYYNIIRADLLPAQATAMPFKEKMGTAAKKGVVEISGVTVLHFDIGGRHIMDDVRISPNLNRELIIGAGTMQKWDISVQNTKGHTRVVLKKDMHDPDIMLVE